MDTQLVEEIELSITEAREFVEQGRALDRLTENRDFKAIITEGYFKDEAVRLVHLKASPAMQNDERQKAVLTSIDAIGNLYQYLMKLERQAEMAEGAIADSEEALSEMAEEGDV